MTLQLKPLKYMLILLLVLPLTLKPYADSQAQSDKLQVLATYSILGDVVQNVGGEAIELSVLVGPDGDAHTFEPTPQDGISLLEADLIFENGLEFETWLDDLYEASGSEAPRVDVSMGIETLAFEEAGHDHEGEEHKNEGEDHEHEGEDQGHDHGEFDPHTWQNPQNVILMAQNIQAALSEADPANAEAYAANAQDYIAELEALDAEIEATLASIPAENRKLVTSHDALGYFADRYGFEVLVTVLPATTEAADPSAGELAEIIETIQAAGIPAVFIENIANPDLMERIAQEAGVELAPSLYTDALGEAGSDGDTYLNMMRYNTRVLAEALGG
jgi:zinc/manganese transport system substrate-binding protein